MLFRTTLGLTKVNNVGFIVVFVVPCFHNLAVFDCDCGCKGKFHDIFGTSETTVGLYMTRTVCVCVCVCVCMCVCVCVCVCVRCT